MFYLVYWKTSTFPAGNAIKALVGFSTEAEMVSYKAKHGISNPIAQTIDFDTARDIACHNSELSIFIDAISQSLFATGNTSQILCSKLPQAVATISSYRSWRLRSTLAPYYGSFSDPFLTNFSEDQTDNPLLKVIVAKIKKFVHENGGIWSLEDLDQLSQEIVAISRSF